MQVYLLLQAHALTQKDLSRGWIPGYLSSQPLLKREKCEIIDAIMREAWTKQNLQLFDERFHSLVERYGIANELKFNLDETSIHFTQKYRDYTKAVSNNRATRSEHKQHTCRAHTSLW